MISGTSGRWNSRWQFWLTQKLLVFYSDLRLKKNQSQVINQKAYHKNNATKLLLRPLFYKKWWRKQYTAVTKLQTKMKMMNACTVKNINCKLSNLVVRKMCIITFSWRIWCSSSEIDFSLSICFSNHSSSLPDTCYAFYTDDFNSKIILIIFKPQLSSLPIDSSSNIVIYKITKTNLVDFNASSVT